MITMREVGYVVEVVEAGGGGGDIDKALIMSLCRVVEST